MRPQKLFLLLVVSLATLPATISFAVDEIRLVQGKVLSGEILRENERMIMFRMPNYGIMEIRRDQIVEIAKGGTLPPAPAPTPIVMTEDTPRPKASAAFSSRLNVGGKLPTWMNNAATTATLATKNGGTTETLAQGGGAPGEPAAGGVDAGVLATTIAKLQAGEELEAGEKELIAAIKAKTADKGATLSSLEKRALAMASAKGIAEATASTPTPTPTPKPGRPGAKPPAPKPGAAAPPAGAPGAPGAAKAPIPPAPAAAGAPKAAIPPAPAAAAAPEAAIPPAPAAAGAPKAAIPPAPAAAPPQQP